MCGTVQNAVEKYRNENTGEGKKHRIEYEYQKKNRERTKRDNIWKHNGWKIPELMKSSDSGSTISSEWD